MNSDFANIFFGKEKFYLNRPNWPVPFILKVISKSGVKEGDCVVDIGSGQGMLSLALAKSGLKVYAVETNPDMIEEQERRLEESAGEIGHNIIKHYKIINSLAAQTNIDKATADLITIGDASHWLKPQLEETITEFKNILKPNGKVAVLSHRLDADEKFIEELHNIFEVHCPDYKEKVVLNILDGNNRAPSKKEAIDYLDENKMEYLSDHITQKIGKEKFIDLTKSFSFMPTKYDEENKSLLIYKLEEFFSRHKENDKGKDTITLTWKTEAYLGPLNWRAKIKDSPAEKEQGHGKAHP